MCASVHDFLREFVAPSDLSSFLIQETGDTKGRTCEGSIVLLVEVARQWCALVGGRSGSLAAVRCMGQHPQSPGAWCGQSFRSRRRPRCRSCGKS